MPRDYRATITQQPPPGSGQRECTRGTWCTGYRLEPKADGTGTERLPGLTYQAFCAHDTTLIATHLSDDEGLPAAYLRLRAALGDPARRGQVIRVPFGPRMLLSEYYDMLMRRIAWSLGSWEERTRTAARLTRADTRQSVLRDGYRAVGQASRILAAHLSALLALPPEPMIRYIPSGELAATPWQDNAQVIANSYGTAALIGEFSGADAGLEIIDLHRRALVALGEVATHPEILDGIPCRSCGTMGLERAEPPSDPAVEADYSRCPDKSCGDRMKLVTYRQWVARYEAWAKSDGPLTCRRCDLGDCGQCIWPGCECAGTGHPQAA